MKKSLSALAVTALTLAAVGCGAPPELPPLEALYVQKPSTAVDQPAAAGNTTAQALCASDFDVTALDDVIDNVNQGIEDQIALLEKLSSVPPRRQGGDTWTWVVEEQQSKLTLTATVIEEGVLYTATFSHPLIGDYQFMDGALIGDNSAGGWTFYALGGAPIIDVDYTNDASGFAVTRSNLITNTVADYSLADTSFAINFTAPRFSASAAWDTVSYDGRFQVNDDAPVCWDYTEENGDFCAAECL
jgi:hypothetical protein